jgi:hypothetical protein
MPSSDPLCRLLDVLQPSLAMYLADSGLWNHPGRESIKLAIADLVGDHRSLVERAAVVIEDRGVAVPSLGGQVAAIDAIIASTAADGVASELAAEAKATTLSHIDVLEQVATSPS